LPESALPLAPEAPAGTFPPSRRVGEEDRLVALVDAGVEVFDLARPMYAGMAQSPNHPEFRLALLRRHGDTVRADGSSAANELIVTGGHVGTHIDALCHVSHDGMLHGGVDAATAQAGGRFSQLGIDTVAPFVCRGLLLDVPAALGIASCPPAYEITPADLAAAAAGLPSPPRPGDVLLVRSGWGSRFEDRTTYIGHDCGVPGPGAEGAHWLAGHRPRAVGADTIAFEQLAPGAGHALLPAHRILLVEEGIHIIETLDLEELSARSVREFLFVMAPLALVGATGSPVRPLAVVTAQTTGEER
jgi:kynurenine formamidase